MKVELFPFQKRALSDIRMKTAEALGSYHRTHAPQVVSFTAPTGAGKTIIMSALIESILYGDDSYAEQPNAIIVWLSDSPQLNEQSKLKIDSKADKIRLSQCVTVTEDSFDKETFRGRAYLFLKYAEALCYIEGSPKMVITVPIPFGKRWPIPSEIRVTAYTSLSMRHIVVCRVVKPAKPRQSCRSSSRVVTRIISRRCLW